MADKIIIGILFSFFLFYPLYIRDKKARIPGVFCAGIYWTWLFFPIILCLLNINFTMFPNKVFCGSDSLNNLVHSIWLGPLYVKGKEVFWNPYIFSGMPHFPISGNNLRVEYWSYLIANNFFIILGIIISYTCLRLNPSRIEIKIYKIITGRTEETPNVVIIGLLSWATLWLIILLIKIL